VQLVHEGGSGQHGKMGASQSASDSDSSEEESEEEERQRQQQRRSEAAPAPLSPVLVCAVHLCSCVLCGRGADRLCWCQESGDVTGDVMKAGHLAGRGQVGESAASTRLREAQDAL
jgi:hypothetical protein